MKDLSIVLLNEFLHSLQDPLVMGMISMQSREDGTPIER